jgi:protein-S-isoprenylcysteine O-methyltransferase
MAATPSTSKKREKKLKEPPSPVSSRSDSGPWNPRLDTSLRAREASTIQHSSPNTIDKELYPAGQRSLSGIALRAFLLGSTLGLSICAAILLLYHRQHLWRAPFFVASLCVFHFLEFWTTAEFNTPTATIAAFLFTNGKHYRQAHTFALIETVITSFFFPEWQSRVNPPLVIFLGLAMMLVGQGVRTIAMAQAGTNFNHQVQSKRNYGHELVTTGLYYYFRHPSYFGFFWWGLGTQIVLGNAVSFVGYVGVLWYFFNTRIRRKFALVTRSVVNEAEFGVDEEKHLVEFFGDEYVAYRARTSVWIPFI